MTTKTKKTTTSKSKCQFCGSDTTELCQLSTATTIIDGKVYSACCIKCAGTTNEEEKPKKDTSKAVKPKKAVSKTTKPKSSKK